MNKQSQNALLWGGAALAALYLLSKGTLAKTTPTTTASNINPSTGQAACQGTSACSCVWNKYCCVSSVFCCF